MDVAPVGGGEVGFVGGHHRARARGARFGKKGFEGAVGGAKESVHPVSVVTCSDAGAALAVK